MAKPISIPSKEVQLVIVGPKNYFKTSRVQSVNLNADVPSNQISELGSRRHAGQSKDVPNVTMTFNAMDVGVKIFSVLTGTDWNAYPPTGVDITELREIDAIIYTKNPAVEDYLKSIHARRLQVQTMNLNYTLEGEATEEYTVVGSKRTLFRYDVIVDRFTSGTTSFNLTQTPIQLSNGDYALSVILDGQYLEEVSTSPATGEYRISGTTLTTGDSRTSQVLVVYHANPAGTNWVDVSDPLMPAAIRGKDIPITIAANDIRRVQSVTVTANINTQPVGEMGNPDKIVGYQTDQPTVEGTITVLDTDTDLINLITTGTIGSGVVEWNPATGCTTVPLELKIELRDPCDYDTVLKTVVLDAIAPIGDVYTVNVGQQAQLAINFRSESGSLKIYSGAVA